MDIYDLLAHTTNRLLDARRDLRSALETGDYYCLIPEAEEEVTRLEKAMFILHRVEAQLRNNVDGR